MGNHHCLFNLNVYDEKNEIENKQNIKDLKELEENHKIEIDNLKKEIEIQIQHIKARRWF